MLRMMMLVRGTAALPRISIQAPWIVAFLPTPMIVVFDPGLLMPVGDFKEQLETLVAEIKATPRQHGVSEIRIPSERAYAERDRRVAEGIDVPRAIVGKIEDL